MTVNINNVIRTYLAFFPIANGPINGDSSKFIFAGTRIGNERYAMGRVDHNFSAQTTLSGSYQFDNTTEGQPDPYDEKLTGSPSRHNNAVMTLQHVFSPSLLNAARMGVSRSHVTDSLDQSAISPVATDTSLGYVPGRPAGILTVAGLTGTQGGIGASGAHQPHYTSFQGGDEPTW